MKKHSFEHVKKYIESRRFKCLSTSYTGSHKKIKLLCPNDHIIEMSWNSFYNNKAGCRLCAVEKVRKSIDEVKSIIINSGYEWISGDYKDVYSKLKVKCKEGHIFIVRFDSIVNGHYCSICSNKNAALKRTGENNYMWVSDRSLVYRPYTDRFHNISYRKQILNEQNNICPICDKIIEKNIAFHHIDYDKGNDNRENLVAVHNKCHPRTNGSTKNRLYWKQILSEKNKKILQENMREHTPSHFRATTSA
jgi:hypothetical protein